ncbi:hypothetical protein J6590_016253 [Homalodisca vitripennis]|nr:hypothetical protein J6590_016253 [Homalodisca vitripennis]
MLNKEFSGASAALNDYADVGLMTALSSMFPEQILPDILTSDRGSSKYKLFVGKTSSDSERDADGRRLIPPSCEPLAPANLNPYLVNPY